MLARRTAVHVVRRSFVNHSQQWHIRHRQFSSSNIHAASQPTPNHSIVAGITAELDHFSPRIDINADQIQILEGPRDFYETLKIKLHGAKRRIYLATLYVGKTEHELVDCIREALRASPKLRVSILTDALRGTREDPEPSCASLLTPLVSEFPGQVEIRMYHTPNLTGFRKSIIPKRINEGWGLQHMKLYGIDDEIILSGANLSNDYFTNRQDRYHVFSSKKATDYFAEIHHTMCSLSFLLRPAQSPRGWELEWPSQNEGPSPLENPKKYIEYTAAVFERFIAPTSTSGSPTSTSIYPLLIIPNALNNELPIIQSLLTMPLPRSSSYLFTAGYFNPHPSITVSLLAASSEPSSSAGTVLTASPWANGFYGSKGVSGMLPPAYTLLSRRFLRRARREASDAVELREWRLGTVGRPHGWTYHAKGLWLTFGSSGRGDGPQEAVANPAFSPGPQTPSEKLEESEGPSVTVIGSSNYTVRSYSLDTEVGAVIVTTDKDLKTRLKAEGQNLLRHSRVVSEQDLQGGERRVGLGVRLAMWIVTAVGGSL